VRLASFSAIPTPQSHALHHPQKTNRKAKKKRKRKTKNLKQHIIINIAVIIVTVFICLVPLFFDWI